jgi:hypothetical protein
VEDLSLSSREPIDMSLSYDLQFIEPILTKGPQDNSWQQDFQIVGAVAEDKAADVFLAMEQEAQSFINTYNLRALFDWANQIANRSTENLDICAKQAEAMSLVIDRASQLARARARGPDRIPFTEKAKDLDAAAKSAHTIACTLDQKITKEDQLSIIDAGRLFADEIVKTWYRGELNPYILELTLEEVEGLKHFFCINENITRCYASSAQFSSDTWKKIQQHMLQPFAEKGQDSLPIPSA